jgi:hypothetical protein
MRWCIGNGELVNVWKDPWLRCLENSYITSSIPHGYETLGLIFDSAGHTNWKWNIISSIAMVHRGEDNTRVWNTKTKTCTLIDNEKYRIPSDSSKLWSLKIPQIVKILLWRGRVVRGCLSTRDIFQRKGVQCTNACPFCENRYEYEWHLFLECEKANEVRLPLICGHKLILWC